MPYRVYGGLRFFDRAEIKDIIAYLRLLSNCDDDTAFERIINVPPRGIGERTLQAIRSEAQQQQISLWQAAQYYVTTMSAGRISSGIRQFFQILGDIISTIDTMSLPTLVEYTLQKTGLLEYVKTQPGEKTQGRVENCREFVQACAQFQQSFETQEGPQGNSSITLLPAFLSDIALDSTDKENDEDNNLKLMTLHAAKGLEFPLVFMAGMEDGLFPHHRCLYDQTLLEEERRLCYVGITRAMRKLYFTYAEKRAFSGLSGLNRPSRFMQEIPPALIENVFLNTKVNLPHRLAVAAQEVKSDFPYSIGEQVRHARFGEGVVTAGDGDGENARVQVNFQSCGKKWLVVSYAKLEVVL
jgi:DNA helicase-2/ATP-dependent DNA helicase PcrA